MSDTRGRALLKELQYGCVRVRDRGGSSSFDMNSITPISTRVTCLSKQCGREGYRSQWWLCGWPERENSFLFVIQRLLLLFGSFVRLVAVDSPTAITYIMIENSNVSLIYHDTEPFDKSFTASNWAMPFADVLREKNASIGVLAVDLESGWAPKEIEFLIPVGLVQDSLHKS